MKGKALMKTLAYHAAMLRTKQVQEKKEQQFTLCCKLIKFALQVEVVLPVSKVFFGRFSLGFWRLICAFLFLIFLLKHI